MTRRMYMLFFNTEEKNKRKQLQQLEKKIKQTQTSYQSLEREILFKLNQIKREKEQLENLKEEVQLLLGTAEEKPKEDVSVVEVYSEEEDSKRIKRTQEMEDMIERVKLKKWLRARGNNYMDKVTAYEFKPRKIKIYR